MSKVSNDSSVSQAENTTPTAVAASAAATAVQDSRFEQSALVNIGLAATLACLSLLIYTSALRGVFLFDDLPNIVENRAIRGNLRDSLASTRPVTSVSFAINYAWSKLSTSGFHWFNNLVHALAAAFLYLLLEKTFKKAVVGFRSPRLMAFCTALIWSVHPLNTQAVTYIVQRAESLMGLAFFAFLWLIVKSAQSKHAWIWLAAAYTVQLAGLGCKEVMLMALPVGLLYDRVFLSLSWRSVFTSRGWFWGLGFATVAVAAIRVVPVLIDSQVGVGFNLNSVNPAEYARTQPEVILHYLRLVFWPDPLIFDYGWPPESRLWAIIASGITLLALIVASVVSLIRGRKWGFGPLSALIVLAPTSSFAPLQDLAAEHRMYVPMAIVLALLVLLLFKLSALAFQDKANLLSVAICCSLTVVLSMQTISRNQTYHSSITMWKDVLAKTVEAKKPNMYAARAFSNLGEAYGDKEQWIESIEMLEKAAQYPNFPSRVHGNLARAFLATKQFDAALLHAEYAFKLEPNSARLRQQAGLIAAARQDYNLAEEYFREAIKLDSGDAVIMINLAQVLMAKKEHNEAEKLLRSALEIDGSLAIAYERLIVLLMEQSKFSEAEPFAERLRSSFPITPERNSLLGNLYAASGKREQALRLWEQAAAAENPPRLINFQLGNIYRNQGSLSLAEKYYQRELASNPECVDALNNLAGLTAQHNPVLAIKYFERVVELAPNYLQAEFNIAAIYANQGNIQTAVAKLESILVKQADFAPARELLSSLQRNATK